MTNLLIKYDFKPDKDWCLISSSSKSTKNSNSQRYIDQAPATRRGFGGRGKRAAAEGHYQ